MPFLRQDLRLFGVSLTSWLQGALMGGNEFVTGQRAKLLLLDRVLDQLFSQCDVVVQTDPVPFDIIGLPELALPIGFGANNSPIGLILGGQPYEEHRLLAVGAAYQALSDWHLRRPANPAGTAPLPISIEPGKPARPPGRGPRPLSGRVGPAPADPSRGRLTAEEVAENSQ